MPLPVPARQPAPRQPPTSRERTENILAALFVFAWSLAAVGILTY